MIYKPSRHRGAGATIHGVREALATVDERQAKKGGK